MTDPHSIRYGVIEDERTQLVVVARNEDGEAILALPFGEEHLGRTKAFPVPLHSGGQGKVRMTRVPVSKLKGLHFRPRVGYEQHYALFDEDVTRSSPSDP